MRTMRIQNGRHLSVPLQLGLFFNAFFVSGANLTQFHPLHDLNVLSSTLLPFAIEISKLVNTLHKLRLTVSEATTTIKIKEHVCGQRL